MTPGATASGADGRVAVPPADQVAPAAPALRRLLALAALLVFLAGVQLFVFTLRTERYFAWTIDPPMTAVFLGASYWSAVGLELAGARSRTWAGARIAVPAVFVFTTLTLVITIAHRDRFHFGAEHEASTRAVTWAWLAIYAVVPVLMVLAVLTQRRVSTAVPPRRGLPAWVKVVLVVQAAVLLALGSALLVDPGWADAAWPWPLSPLTGRAIGAWLVGLGVASAHALVVDDRPSLRPLGITGVLFGALQGIALLRHGDALDWGGVPASGYVAGLVVITAISAWAVLPVGAPGPDQPTPGGEITAAWSDAARSR